LRVTFDFLKKISEIVGRLGHRFSSNWCGRRWRLRLRFSHVLMNISMPKASVQWKMQLEMVTYSDARIEFAGCALVTLNHLIRTSNTKQLFVSKKPPTDGFVVEDQRKKALCSPSVCLPPLS
jgi:hypothetical protein